MWGELIKWEMITVMALNQYVKRLNNNEGKLGIFKNL